MPQQSVHFSKEIAINKDKAQTFSIIKAISGIQKFTIVSEIESLNKIILAYGKDKIEVSINRTSDDSSIITVMILDANNNYYNTSDIASNITQNFENALVATLENKQGSFKEIPLKVDNVSCLVQVIVLIVAAFAIAYAVISFLRI